MSSPRLLALSALVLLLSGMVSVAAAQEPYPYFRRDLSSSISSMSSSSSKSSMSSTSSSPVYAVPTSSSSASSSSVVRVSSSSVSSITNEAKVGVSLRADRDEAMPGDDVLYRIAITNLFNQSLPPWKLAFFFDGTQLQVINAGGGRIEGGHILFNIPAMGSGQKMELMVRMHVYRKLRAGDTARTYASMVWDGSIQPACAKHDLRVIERPPVTGAGDGTSTVENLGAFLRPVNAASNGSAMPLLVWVSVGGLVLGLGLGKKFLAI